MRRLTIGLTAAVVLLVLGPSGALASDHGTRHLRRVEHARVAHFGGGVLTIRLRDGSTLKGRVNRATALECRAPEQMRIVHDRHRSANDGPGDRGDANDNEVQEPPENEAAEPPENEAQEPPENEAQAPRNEAAEPRENEVDRSCSTMNLRPGAVVRAADLRISRFGRAWKKVELDL